MRFNGHLPYWRNEENEDLTNAVKILSAYMDNLRPDFFTKAGTVQNTTQAELNTLKAYISLWANYPAWKVPPEKDEILQNLRTSAAQIDSIPSVVEWLKTANSIGIDPF